MYISDKIQKFGTTDLKEILVIYFGSQDTRLNFSDELNFAASLNDI